MSKALSIELMWNIAGAAEICSDQQWVLSAMSKHGSQLVQVLWRILGNESDLCDAYQETFLKLAGMSQSPEPDKIRAYLFRTASNAAIDILRKRRSRQRLHENLSRTMVKEYEPESNYFDMSHLAESLRSQLSRLPDNLQQVVMLRDLGDMSYRQVAEVLGITAETARVYRRRAIIMLAEMMEGGD